MYKHESRNKYYHFMEENFQKIVPVDERIMSVELPVVVWNSHC